MSVQKLSRTAAVLLGLLGVLILAMGIFFTYYGGKLVSVKGSPYFLISGCLLILSGVQIEVV